VSQSQGCNPGDPPPPNNIPFTNPVYAYPHVSQNANLDSAVTLVSYYKGTNSNYPVSYQNSLYVGDFVQGWIKRLKYNTATTNWDLQPGNFATGPSSAIGLKEGPDGNLYYLVLYTSDSVAMSEVRRIRYVGSNLKPNAVGAIVSPQSVPGTQTPLAFTFSAAGSNDPDNTLPLKYVWNFGDGGGDQPATSSLTVSHTYAAPGIYDVTLQVLDNLGMGSDVLTLKVFPGNTPASGNIQLTNLTDGSRCNTGNFTSPCIYYAGDQYQIDAVNVADPDGDGLDANPIAWSVVFHHSTHTHPFQSNLVGASKQFVIPQEGEYDPNVWYRVHLYITDAKGQITEYVRDINPVKVTVTFQTNLVSGSQILLNAAYFPSPKVVTRVVGMQIPIDAPSPQTVGGTQYYFLNWSNAGTQSQVITVPNVNTVYTATMLSGVAPSLNFFNTHTPIVTWERISWADAYEVQVSQSASFTPLIPVGQPVSAASMALTLPCINNGVYYWRVRALRFYDSIPGSWSATQSFTVDTTGTCP
jgi:PKD repeat protein